MNFVCKRQDCPGVRLTDSRCVTCGMETTVQGMWRRFSASCSARLKMLEPRRQQAKELTARFRNNTRAVGWSYVLLSGILFWVLLGILGTHFMDGWVKRASLTVIYLAVFILLCVWIFPRKSYEAIGWQYSRPVRFGIFLNYFSGLFIFQMCLARWWDRSVILAGLFVVNVVGIWVFWRLLIFLCIVIVQLLYRTPRQDFDRRGPQGRTVEWD